MPADISDFRPLIAQIAGGDTLSVDQARQAFDIMMSGNATPAQMGGFLVGLALRGETVDEITGGVMTMRAKMTAIAAPDAAIDIVGTGGDGLGTFNVSTGAALVVAACGVPVAKHGNRAASSKTGTADVLSALGVNLDADFTLVQKALDEAGLCFMLAPRHHGAMRNVGPTRVELGTRTIFNILGPMSNPAGVKRQLIGVFADRWRVPMAQTLRELGSERVWVVHGSDGADELTTTGVSRIAALEDGEIREFELRPEEAGLQPVALEALKGGAPEENAAALKAMLQGEPGAFRDIVLYNAAAGLMIAGEEKTLTDGVARAAEAIDAGKAFAKLEALARITNEDIGA